MPDGFNAKTLRLEILELSEADHWDIAKQEWGLVEIFDAEEPQSCLCGHYPIIEVCTIKNKKNGQTAEVGNVCVKKFMGLRSDKVFSAVKKVRESLDRALNAESIEFFRERDVINKWEYNFYMDTWRKNRGLTSAQLNTRRRINTKVLAAIARRDLKATD